VSSTLIVVVGAEAGMVTAGTVSLVIGKVVETLTVVVTSITSASTGLTSPTSLSLDVNTTIDVVTVTSVI
jgi:hypothetical protein